MLCGKLIPVYLMALRFGGTEDASNAVYAPAVVAELKDKYTIWWKIYSNRAK